MSHNKKMLWGTIAACFASLSLVGGIVVWAGDQRWVTNVQLVQVSTALQQQVNQLEINSLDRQITFLQIKIDQGEATTSERIYIQALRQQLRALQSQ